MLGPFLAFLPEGNVALIGSTSFSAIYRYIRSYTKEKAECLAEVKEDPTWDVIVAYTHPNYCFRHISK